MKDGEWRWNVEVAFFRTIEWVALNILGIKSQVKCWNLKSKGDVKMKLWGRRKKFLSSEKWVLPLQLPQPHNATFSRFPSILSPPKLAFWMKISYSLSRFPLQVYSNPKKGEPESKCILNCVDPERLSFTKFSISRLVKRAIEPRMPEVNREKKCEKCVEIECNLIRCVHKILGKMDYSALQPWTLILKSQLFTAIGARKG